ncbi:hypothetical protein EDC01DRAFT_636958 [Geopyxis carbonaria]|nr:hypothetical protein EDC01DRAFT_636958 [Geopyxis carbonaria]
MASPLRLAKTAYHLLACLVLLIYAHLLSTAVFGLNLVLRVLGRRPSNRALPAIAMHFRQDFEQTVQPANGQLCDIATDTDNDASIDALLGIDSSAEETAWYRVWDGNTRRADIDNELAWQERVAAGDIDGLLELEKALVVNSEFPPHWDPEETVSEEVRVERIREMVREVAGRKRRWWA